MNQTPLPFEILACWKIPYEYINTSYHQLSHPCVVHYRLNFNTSPSPLPYIFHLICKSGLITSRSRNNLPLLTRQFFEVSKTPLSEAIDNNITINLHHPSPSRFMSRVLRNLKFKFNRIKSVLLNESHGSNYISE